MIKKTVLFTSFLFFFFFAFANNDVLSDAITNSDNLEQIKEEKSEEFKQNTSLTESVSDKVEERRDIIKYGLEADVIDLIKELEKEEDSSFNAELTALFSNSYSANLKSSILTFFAAVKNGLLNDAVLKMLTEKENYTTQELKSCLLYARENNLKDALPEVSSILKDETSPLLEDAIIAIGSLGGGEQALFLADFYQNLNLDDEKKESIIKESIIRALENNVSEELFDFLAEIIEDEGENAVLKSLAVLALSNIKTDEAFQKLLLTYSSNNPLLRVSAIKGISKSDDERVGDIIKEALKDSYYKVRIEAINAISSSSEEVISSLLYRVKNDPENIVKLLAIEKLSTLHSTKANEVLTTIFNDEKASTSIRVKIASSLLKEDFDIIIADVERVAIEATKSEKYKNIRSELGKIVSKIKNERTAKIAEAYINHKDVFVKSLGLDMFATNRYSSLLPLIEDISENEKMGALQKRATSLLKGTSSDIR